MWHGKIRLHFTLNQVHEPNNWELEHKVERHVLNGIQLSFEYWSKLKGSWNSGLITIKGGALFFYKETCKLLEFPEIIAKCFKMLSVRTFLKKCQVYLTKPNLDIKQAIRQSIVSAKNWKLFLEPFWRWFYSYNN